MSGIITHVYKLHLEIYICRLDIFLVSTVWTPSVQEDLECTQIWNEHITYINGVIFTFYHLTYTIYHDIWFHINFASVFPTRAYETRDSCLYLMEDFIILLKTHLGLICHLWHMCWNVMYQYNSSVREMLFLFIAMNLNKNFKLAKKI